MFDAQSHCPSCPRYKSVRYKRVSLYKYVYIYIYIYIYIYVAMLIR